MVGWRDAPGSSSGWSGSGRGCGGDHIECKAFERSDTLEVGLMAAVGSSGLRSWVVRGINFLLTVRDRFILQS